MQQLTYTGPGELRWEEVAAPQLAGDVGALVRPLAVATCDLDDLIIAGGSPFPAPFAIGHECVAEVIDLGDDVRGVQPGDRVVVPFQISCGSCAACQRGHTSNCLTVARSSTYGFGPQVGVWGGFLSDLVLVPYADHMLVPVPSELGSAAVASASDNIADAWRTVAPGLAREPGAPVMVVGGFGPGSIGLYAVAAALALGSESVLYVDRDPARCTLARELGAQVHDQERPRRLGPFPITVDAAGDPGALPFALRCTAPDGVCTSAAIYFTSPPELPLLEMYEKVITFRTGRAHVRADIPAVLQLAADGALRPELVTTRVVGWSDARAALLERDWTKLVAEREPTQRWG
jgi:threonine dehydrogenase-like Zn-dependent dehydrogenase